MNNSKTLNREIKLPSGPFLDFEVPVVKIAKHIEALQKEENVSVSDITKLQVKKEQLLKKSYKKIKPWDRVMLSRRVGRPLTQDYLTGVFTDFVELKGDRLFGEDSALVAGFAKIGSQSVVIVGHQKGKNTKENLLYNFGMANPEGYRKALRVFKLAERFGLPIISLIDTPGAYPGLGAEERGQGEAIAHNILEMTRLSVPIISVVIGEGASGGALGIGVCDRLLMLENTWYSVISPEGCAAILWKDDSKKKNAAEILNLTAEGLKKDGIVDRVIKEPLGGAHWDKAATIQEVKKVLLEELVQLQKNTEQQLITKRIKKYASVGSNL